MADVESPQAFVQSLVGGAEVQSSQVFAFSVIGFPTPEIHTSEAYVQVPVAGSGEVQVSQVFLRAVVRGRIENPRLKTWKFKLDGHEFYVIRLGEDKTLVFDLATRQWSWWSSINRSTWRPNVGINWRTPGDSAFTYGSNVVVGDDTFGLLWVLNPEQGYDNSPTAGDTTELRFRRRATAQITARGREFIPVYDLYLTASPAAPAYLGAEVTLNYSDDGGQNYVNAGNIAIDETNYVQEFAWRSLGRIQAPGRLFQILDDGAFSRIDSLDINTNSG